MHPVLLEIGPLRIYSYGVFAAAGVLAAAWVAAREYARAGGEREAFEEAAFFALLGGIAGARLFHVLVSWRSYAAQPLEILRLWHGGLVYYGGLLGGLAAAFAATRRRKIPFLAAADAAALGLPLGLALGRAGCLLAGCCYGKPSALPWAVVYTDPAAPAPLYVPLHPAQVYEALAALGIFALLAATRARFRTAGMRFWTFLLLYGAGRFALERYRDDPRGFLGPLSESQLVSVLLGLYAAASIVRAGRRTAPRPGP